ncbi:NAD(P)/FAD-dependent oxidoreductase [Pleomorphovibrio marinus]|uniref:NAD(P)/FAD-dependent oxidoreductase n=1 Tax=Pleomorphovibrio marinus TaxID=2164132 RepID=UPI000E0ACBEA|nr:FAD-dependent oxidoreductase [Pleomorphovibrio marinus]
MKKEIQLTLSPEQAHDSMFIHSQSLRQLGIDPAYEGAHVRQDRRSIDARGKKVKINISATVFIDEAPSPLLNVDKDYSNVCNADPILIVGAGPAGLFAALRAIELGHKPILFERGKDVRSRRRDLAAINKYHVVDTESNYCFGEGGAGTYSDGKLYTRSKKRGDVRRIMEILVAHGASEQILVEAHPHIGTNKLPILVAALRASILEAGGEIHFNTKVVDFIIENGELTGIKTHEGDSFKGLGVILATGHSARDIFELLQKKGVEIHAKPFALGVRIEHPQGLIDSIQYKCGVGRGPYLPAAAYSLVQQTQFQEKQRGVFSFCMCPGGFIVPAATAPGEIVVNGMSPSRRDGKFANSGIVAAVEVEDLQDYRQYGPLAGMYFQKEVEQKAWAMGGMTQRAPAQRLMDFVQGKTSQDLLNTSYQPGLQSANMMEVLPLQIGWRLKEAFLQFGNKMKGYLTNEAQLIGVESRTSSPVRIPRDRESFEHPGLKRLFPCGEGAGYAGGIVSAAMDGERCAERLVAIYKKRPNLAKR